MSWSPKYTSTGSKCDGELPANTAPRGVIAQAPEERRVPGGLGVCRWPEANLCSRWEEYWAGEGAGSKSEDAPSADGKE